jgi:hypothetical protein
MMGEGYAPGTAGRRAAGDWSVNVAVRSGLIRVERSFIRQQPGLYDMSDRQPEAAVRRVDDEDGDRPEVPVGVLDGIEDLSKGRTIGKDDLGDILKF